MKHKCPAELNSRVVRINLGDYLLLAGISRRAEVTMAEAFHRLIEHQAQLPLPELRVTGEPTFRVTGMPAIQVEPVTTAYRAELKTATATNGSKGAAFRIKPKGARHD